MTKKEDRRTLTNLGLIFVFGFVTIGILVAIAVVIT